MRIPLRYQFMLPLLTVAIASLVAIGIFNSRLATRQIKARIESQLQGVVTVLASSNYPLTDTVLRQMGGLAHAEFVLTNASGEQLASSGLVGDHKLAADSNTRSTDRNFDLGAEIVLGGRTYFYSSTWVRRNPFDREKHVLHILFAKDDFNAAWRTALLPSLSVGAVAVVAVVMVTHLVAGRISKVLSLLGREVERLAKGDFSPVRRPEWNDETSDLALAVNQAADRLAEYSAELRQTERLRTVSMLGAGLAHEMRNAATGCRLAVDLHAEGCQGELADESLDVARRQLSLMENKLTQLLQLGRQSSTADELALSDASSNRRSHVQATNLSALVSESVALIRPAAHHAGIRLIWQQLEPEVLVHADAEMLGQAVMNLLLNALDAAAKSHRGARQNERDDSAFVRVDLQRYDGEMELVVTDSGVGPDPALAESVFSPFVTTKSEGVGLGLAVAKRVVESCGGSIQWNRNADLTNFSIRMPNASQGESHV